MKSRRVWASSSGRDHTLAHRRLIMAKFGRMSASGHKRTSSGHFRRVTPLQTRSKSIRLEPQLVSRRKGQSQALSSDRLWQDRRISVETLASSQAESRT